MCLCFWLWLKLVPWGHKPPIHSSDMLLTHGNPFFTFAITSSSSYHYPPSPFKKPQTQPSILFPNTMALSTILCPVTTSFASGLNIHAESQTLVSCQLLDLFLWLFTNFSHLISQEKYLTSSAHSCFTVSLSLFVEMPPTPLMSHRLVTQEWFLKVPSLSVIFCSFVTINTLSTTSCFCKDSDYSHGVAKKNKQ